MYIVCHCLGHCTIYRSVPLIRLPPPPPPPPPPPHFVHCIQPKVGRMQLVSLSTIRPLKKFFLCWYTNYYDTAKVHVYSYKSTNDRQYCSWSSCVVSQHQREELPLEREGHIIHDDFAIAILKNSNTIGHVPWDISCRRVAAR